MTKRASTARARRVRAAVADAGVDSLAAASAAIAEETIPDGDIFTIGSWSGFTQWKCRFCPWDTLKGEAEMRKHYWETHRPMAGPVAVYDRRGRLVPPGEPSNVRGRKD